VSADHAFVAVLRIHLHFPDAGSLKAKRSELNAVKAGLQQRFGASLAEVAHQDSWQRSELLAAVCAGGEGRVTDHVDAVERWLETRLPQGIRMERRIASWGDLESIG
jgi:uncharacterized protein YlxP (DUF503 family)